MFDIGALMGARQAASLPGPQARDYETGGNVIFQLFFHQAVGVAENAAAGPRRQDTVTHAGSCGQSGETENTVGGPEKDQGNRLHVPDIGTARVSGPEEPASDMEVNGVVFSAGRKVQDELRDLFAQMLGIEGYGGFSILWGFILPVEADIQTPQDLVDVIGQIRQSIRSLEGGALDLLPDFARALRDAADRPAGLPLPPSGDTGAMKRFILSFFVTLEVSCVSVTQQTPIRYFEHYFGGGAPRLRPAAPDGGGPAAVISENARPEAAEPEEAWISANAEPAEIRTLEPVVLETGEPEETLISEIAEPRKAPEPETAVSGASEPETGGRETAAMRPEADPSAEMPAAELNPPAGGMTLPPLNSTEIEDPAEISHELAAVPVGPEPDGETLIDSGGGETELSAPPGGGSAALETDEEPVKADSGTPKEDFTSVMASASLRGTPPPVQAEPSPRPVEQTAAARIIDQIAEGFREQAGGTVTKLELELNPASLGRISLAVEHQRDGVSVTLKSASDTVRQILTGNMADLETALRNAGVNMKNLRIEQPNLTWDFARGGQWQDNGSSRQTGGRDGGRRAPVNRSAAAAAENHMAAFLYGAGVTRLKTEDVSLDIRA